VLLFVVKALCLLDKDLRSNEEVKFNISQNCGASETRLPESLHTGTSFWSLWAFAYFNFRNRSHFTVLGGKY